jgi:hypothetical protein
MRIQPALSVRVDATKATGAVKSVVASGPNASSSYVPSAAKSSIKPVLPAQPNSAQPPGAVKPALR